MSRAKIQDLIKELHKPGVNQGEILQEIVRLKKNLGDKPKDPQAKDKKEDKPKKKRSKKSKKAKD